MKTMIAATPEELYPNFADALNRGDVASILALFDAEGQTIPLPGHAPAMGLVAVQGVMEQCLALRPHLTYEKTNVVQADGVALMNSQWRLRGMLPDGNQVESTGKGVQVARRQADGSWRFLIDNPWAGVDA